MLGRLANTGMISEAPLEVPPLKTPALDGTPMPTPPPAGGPRRLRAAALASRAAGSASETLTCRDKEARGLPVGVRHGATCEMREA